MIARPPSGLMRRFVAVACLILAVETLAAESARGDSTPASEIAFFFWHRKGSPINLDEYDPKFPDRYEYLELDEWSPDGWRPRRVDLVLQLAGRSLAGVSAFRTAISVRVGPVRLDPASQLTDVAHLEDNAVWIPAHLVRTTKLPALRHGQRLVLLSNFDLAKLCTDLANRQLWPIELRVDVVSEPLRAKNLPDAVISRTLRVLPGD